MSAKEKIDVSSIWYGLPAEGILNLLGVSHGNLDEGTNILAMRQEVLNQYPVIVFELSDGGELPHAGDSGIATADEIFNYFFDFKKLIEWTGDYFDRVIKNRRVISNLRNALDSGRTIRSYDRFQRQTDLPIEEHFSLILDYPRLPLERFFWIIGGKEKVEDREFKSEVTEYITSDEKKIMLTTPIVISEMPRYYYDPTSGYPFSHQPEIKINNMKIQDTDILIRLVNNRELHSIFLQDNLLLGQNGSAPFNSFVVAVTAKLKKVIYSTFPDCLFSEEIRKNTLLDLYFQSWAIDTSEKSVMIFNPDTHNVINIEDFILKKIESEKDKIFKDGINGSTWLSKTTLESLMQEYTHFTKQVSD